jgi:hypothetical protein
MVYLGGWIFSAVYLRNGLAGKRNRWASFPQNAAVIHSFTGVIHSFLRFSSHERSHLLTCPSPYNLKEKRLYPQRQQHGSRCSGDKDELISGMNKVSS